MTVCFSGAEGTFAMLVAIFMVVIGGAGEAKLDAEVGHGRGKVEGLKLKPEVGWVSV